MDVSHIYEPDERFSKNPLTKTCFWARKIEKDSESLELLINKWWEEASLVLLNDHNHGSSCYSDLDVLYQIAEIVNHFSTNKFPHVDCQPLFSFWFSCWEYGKNEDKTHLEIAIAERSRSVGSLQILRLVSTRGNTKKNSDSGEKWKKPPANLQLLNLYHSNSETLDWSAEKLAEEIGCHPSTVKKTETWKKRMETKYSNREASRERFSEEHWDDEIDLD